MISSLVLQVSLANLSWYKVGGVAKYYAKPGNKEEIKELLQWAKKNKEPVFFMGNASNLVFSDKGFSGLVIHLSPCFNQMRWIGDKAICQSGLAIHKLVREAFNKEMGGVEKLIGVPGTMGGAIFINAGAHDQEMGDVVEKVTSLTADGELVERTVAECCFSYRTSIFCKKEEIILEATLNFSREEKNILQENVRESLQYRKDTQPTNLPNAGSIFKRGDNFFPGQIIEECGLKRLKVGGAEVSDKHANFIVNKDKATAQDIYELTKIVRQTVLDKKGIFLETEIRFIGDFS